MRTAREFLSGIVDYAGLFPPASLGMHDAVHAYAGYLAGPDRDLLGRFIVTSARLGELDETARDILPRGETEPWRISVIAGEDIAADKDAILSFNCSHWKGSELGHAVCDAVELRVAGESDIVTAIGIFPDFFQLFLEVPIATDPEPLISAMKGTRAAAKVRTGGVTPDAIPASAHVLRFLRACSRHRVPFKATAGLHHAIRGDQPLTNESASPRSEMFGYLNIFLAAAFLDAGATDADVLAILEERDPGNFRFDDAGVSWRHHTVRREKLHQVRGTFALSYGSCSFAEPVSEAKQLGLI